ncbi:hypothetical protein ABZ250_17125 [Streptomyces afghaniensis]|uniref:hypothetical protein n=1 Tax=Streptomyces afghaniensis TaxID=66865 RepID=UPI0033A2905D
MLLAEAVGESGRPEPTYGWAHLGVLPDLKARDSGQGQTLATAVFDRSLGFLAVHRETSLVLAAGRVADPKPFPEDEDAYVRGTSGD